MHRHTRNYNPDGQLGQFTHDFNLLSLQTPPQYTGEPVMERQSPLAFDIALRPQPEERKSLSTLVVARPPRPQPTFTCFLELPVELQIQIWRHTWEPREINLEPHVMWQPLRGSPDSTSSPLPLRRSSRGCLQAFRASTAEEKRAGLSEKKKRHAREVRDAVSVVKLVVPENWHVPPLPTTLYLKGVPHQETLACYRPLAFAPGTPLGEQFWLRRTIRANPGLDQVKLGGFARNWTLSRPQVPFFNNERPSCSPSMKPFLAQAFIHGPWAHLRHIVVDGMFFQGFPYLQAVHSYPKPPPPGLASMTVQYGPYPHALDQHSLMREGLAYGHEIIELIEQSGCLETFTIILSQQEFDKLEGTSGGQVTDGSDKKLLPPHRIRLARQRPSEDVLMLDKRGYDHAWAIFMVAPFPRGDPARSIFKRFLQTNRNSNWPSIDMAILAQVPHVTWARGMVVSADRWGQSLATDWEVLLSCWINRGFKSPCQAYIKIWAVKRKLEGGEMVMHPAWMIAPFHGFCAEEYGL
ncbi:hypothetical protein GQ53DRAFT_838295 [Thozetella sp. PMI_491]|nr:hypothetical protein GQ53DRAFT_838295 [Thozetella sp. PMI_491]